MPGKIHVPVTVATDGFTKLQRTFSRLRGVTIGLTTAIAGLGAAAQAIDFSRSAIAGARDLERNYAGLTSVFKDATDQMKEFGLTASDMGLSMNEAAKATTFIGSVLKQSGFSIEETANLTEELVELGADLALTYGYDVQEALLGMTALFRGEYDPIEKFGVAMKQSEIDAEKAARGLDGLTGAAERFADQQIRVEFLMERASDAMGAFERQSGNLTVQQMRLRAEFENVRDTVADGLLPPIADFTGGLREIVENVGPDLENFFDELAPVLDELGRQALPIIENALRLVIDAFGGFVEIIEIAQDPTTDLGDSMLALSESLDRLFGKINEEGPGAEEAINGVAEALEFLADTVTVLVDTINENGDEILAFLGLLVAGRIGGSAVRGAGGRKGASQELQGIATQVAAIGAALAALPKGVVSVGLIGYILGEQIYGPLRDANEGILETSQSFDIATDSAEDFREAFAASAAIRNNPYGALSADVERTADNFTLLGDEVKTVGDMFSFVREQNPPLISDLEGFRDITKSAAEKQADYRDRTLEAYVAQLQLNGAFAQFKLLASTAVDTTTLEGVLEASRGRGMGGGTVGWNAEDYLKGLGLIPPDGSDDDVTGTIQDFVGDFFSGIEEEVAKQQARLDLEAMGLSAALIDQIVGSQGWEEVFDAIIAGGEEMARQLQNDFNRTVKGAKELEDRAKALRDELIGLKEQETDLLLAITAKEEERDAALASATEKFYNFKQSVNLTVDALQTYERQIGRFESQTRSDLQRIESQIQSAFDNGYLLEEARDNLLDYARAELNVLLQIQRQRDELLARRNAAADTIFGVAQAVTAAGNITSLLRDVQDEVKEVQVKELFEDVVESADGLNGFKVTLERNYTDVITNTVSKSKALVNGFQDVIDRTRAFIDNLKLLREMGLDPFLFNQLVQAGAEAGGATAAALVEGGTETVNQVNSLQSELEAMGVELGEQTYEVTKNSGEQFVSGIIDGMDAELERLGEMAITMATGFTQTFEMSFKAGMETAFEGIAQGIRDEFELLIDELEAELDDILSRIRKAESEAADVSREARVARGESIIVEGVEVVEGSSSIGPGNVGDLPASEQAFLREAFPELFPSQSSASSTVNVYNINASNPLDAYNASKGNVEQQSNFQSSNGNISVTLSGVGS